MNAITPPAGFALDPQLAAETLTVIDLQLSRVLLMNDTRFPWLIVVPMRSGLSEISDLDDAAQIQLWQEVNRATRALREVAPCDKINIGALGNIVRQLHVHAVARRIDDAAWPGPVWGHGHAELYPSELAEDRCQGLRDAITRSL